MCLIRKKLSPYDTSIIFIVFLVFFMCIRNIYFGGKFSCWNIFFKYPFFHQDVSCGAICLSPGKYDASEKLRKQTDPVSQSSKVKPFNQNKWKKNSRKYFGIPSQDFPKHLISRQLTAILFPRATVLLHAVTQLCLLIVACCRIPDDVSVCGYVTNSFHPFHWFQYKMTSSAPADVDAGSTSHQPGN